MICNNYHWHISLSQQRHGTFVFLLPMPARLSTEMWGKLVNISINIAAERSRVGSITSRCSGKWARTQDRTRETDQDRTRETAEIEPRSRGETKKPKRYTEEFSRSMPALWPEFPGSFLLCSLLETGNFLSESVLNSGFPYSPLLKQRTIKAMSHSFTAALDSCRKLKPWKQ